MGRKTKNIQWVVFLQTEMHCWERLTENGQTGFSGQNGYGNSDYHSVLWWAEKPQISQNKLFENGFMNMTMTLNVLQCLFQFLHFFSPHQGYKHSLFNLSPTLLPTCEKKRWREVEEYSMWGVPSYHSFRKVSDCERFYFLVPQWFKAHY